MDYVVKHQSAKNFTKDINKGKYSMKHKFQRQENQWNNRQKSLLIDSLCFAHIRLIQLDARLDLMT